MEQEEQGVQIGLSFLESFVIERWMRERDVFVSAAKELGGGGQCTECQQGCGGTDFQIEYFIKKQESMSSW